MTMLIAGLLIFLGVHSVRIFAEPWRTAMRAKLGVNAFKGLYSVLSLVGFALIVWGFGAARQAPVVLWSSPTWTRHLAALLTLAVNVWAAAHLLANNTLADLLLFGGFLIWAALSFRAARQRDRLANTISPPGRLGPTLVTVVLAVAGACGVTLSETH